MAGVNLYSELIRAQLENLSSDPSSTLSGRMYWNTTSGKVMLDDSTNIRAMLRNDQKMILGNNGTAGNNVRFNRSANATLQLVLGSDSTAEGSNSTSLANFLSKIGGCTVDASLLYNQIATPSSPASGSNLLYFKSDDALYIKNSAGSETKVAGVGQTLSLAAKTGNYAVLTTDDVLTGDSSGGTFTFTLPAAATAGTKVYTFQKTDTSFTAITITHAGSDTIAGGASTTLNTLGETVRMISDGVSNWVILDRVIPSVWTAFTPTGAWITTAVYTGFWRRVGDSIILQVKVAMGGLATAATLTLNMLTGLTIDTAKLVQTDNTMIFGSAVSIWDDSASKYYLGAVSYNSSSTLLIGTLKNDAVDIIQGPVTNVAPITFAASDFIQVNTTPIPISGWKS